MIKSFFWSRKWVLWAYGGLLLLLVMIYAQVEMTVAFNSWYGRFYNLLQAALNYKNNPAEGIDLFLNQLISFAYVTGGFKGDPSFAVIVIPYVLLYVFVNWFTRIYTLRWREAITFDYIPRWKNVQADIEGSSQRIQEDCYRWARIVESIGLQIVRALMTLVAFLPILGFLSRKHNIVLPLVGTGWGHVVWFLVLGLVLVRMAQCAKKFCSQKEGFRILQKLVFNLTYAAVLIFIWFIAGIINTSLTPLVWGALVLSFAGTVVSWFVGWYLPGLEYNNQKVEAAFRKDLVLGEDNKTEYAKPEKLWELFLGIKFNYHRLFLHYGYFDCWMILYDQFTIIVPYLIAGPGLFTGAIMLGVMVQISNAFQKVHNGFSLFLHNWTTITELRSIWKRLHEFEENLNRHQVAEAGDTGVS